MEVSAVTMRSSGIGSSLPLAVINGAVREFVIIPQLGVIRSGQVSAILLALAILLLTFVTIRWIAPGTRRRAWLVGFLWVVLVLVFEFGFGLARGTAWNVMLQEYKIWTGRLWVLVPVSAATAPFLTGRLRLLI